MGHARSTKNIPVCAVNRTLVANHQSCNHSRSLRVKHLQLNALAQRLAQPRNGVKPRLSHTLGSNLFGSRTHITRGLNPLLPQPQLVIKTMLVAAAVRRFHPHRQFPTLTGSHRLRLVLKLPRRSICACGRHPVVPTHIHPLRKSNRDAAAQAGRLHAQPETQAGRITLRQLGHDARDTQILAL